MHMMNGLPAVTRVTSVLVADEAITAELLDGRSISVPLAWSWRLSEATPEQRANWRLIGSGQGIHWPDVDEDISVRGMLDGVPAHRPHSHPA
jgi:secreted protein with Ig-like and vWFA domain